MPPLCVPIILDMNQCSLLNIITISLEAAASSLRVKGCRVVNDCSPTLHGTQYTNHSLKYLLPQHRKSHNDVFLLISSTKL